MKQFSFLTVGLFSLFTLFLPGCSSPVSYGHNDNGSPTSGSLGLRTIVYAENDHIWIEAEAGGEYNPMIVKSDQAASGQIYLASWDSGRTSLGSAPSDGNIVYSFDVVYAGTYRLWARVITPDSNSNSYWVKMDSAPWVPWEDINPTPSWGWDHMSADFDLGTGSHELRIAYREASTKLDKLLLTRDLAYTPSGMGNAIPLPGGSVAAHSDVVERYGQLQVIGTQLCDQNGNPVQLKGLSTHGIQWFPIYQHYTIPNLVNDWGIDIIRIAMYVEDWYNGDDFWNGYMAHPQEMKQWVMDFVNDAIDAGIYVIIDWHIHNNPANFTQAAKDFFNEMSSLYGQYPNVLYEICNEIIGGVNWSTVKTYAEQVIPEIRNNDPDNIIIIGTPNWSQYVDEAAADPITGYNNLMYALHFYAGSHHDDIKNRAQDALFGTNTTGHNPNGNRIPLIATEWGTSDYDATYNDFSWSQIWMDFLDANHISWCNWSFSNKDEASSIIKPYVDLTGPWDESDYTESGLWVKSKMSGPSPQFALGDVNHDGEIDIVDALMVSQYCTGMNPSNFDTSLADVNRNGTITEEDALLISQYYVGLIDSF